MTLPKNLGSREYNKFVETDGGNVAIRTVGDTASLAGGASQASGQGVYFAKPSGANGDGLSVYTAATQITVTGLPFTFAAEDIESIEQIPTSGTATIYSDKADFTVASGVITITGAAFAATDVFIVKLTGPVRAYDLSSQAKKGVEVAPVYTHNTPLLQVEVTNETNATNNRRVDVSGYDKVKVAFDGVAGTDSITLTMHASMQDNGTAIASANYQDISQYGVSILTAAATAATYVADASFDIDVKGIQFLDFQTVSAGGANDGDYNLYVKSAY